MRCRQEMHHHRVQLLRNAVDALPTSADSIRFDNAEKRIIMSPPPPAQRQVVIHIISKIIEHPNTAGRTSEQPESESY